MVQRNEPEPASAQEAFGNLTIDHLRPLAGLLTSTVPKRKSELVDFLVGHMTDPARLQELYNQLDALAQNAVREATHDPMGELHNDRFMAHYGQMPAYHHPSQEDTAFRDFYGYKRPTHLALFFPGYEWLPTDVRQLLLCFVPSPSEFTPSTLDELPATFRLTWTAWRGDRRVEESEDVPLRVRETAREAEQDLRAMLRLVEAGRVPDG